jgi:hypothetical protein
VEDTQDKPKEAAKSSEAKETERQDKIAAQVREEFALGEKHIKPWRETKRMQMKLVINQRKNTKLVGDTLMFSTHQTILASIYKDRLDAEWLGREEEDVDRAEQVNSLYEFDYDEMGKAEHDFGKYYDATGYGIAIEDWSHFDRKTLTPIPALWDPLSFVFDPKATSINGNRLGNGACRFIYREITRTRQEMDRNSAFFNVEKLTNDKAKLGEMQRNQDARNMARGLTDGPSEDLKDSGCFVLYQGYTWIEGKRYLVEVGNNGFTLVRLTPLKTEYWPLQDYRVYPDPHSFITPGTWDFTEDKQRARAVLQNYTLDAAKFDVLPEWLFDSTKITNKQQLREHKPGKFIEGKGIDGNTILPLQKPTIHQYSQGIMQELEMNAQKALATPEIQQGILFNSKRTATEIAEASANVDTRYSLTASLFGLSEGNAAYMWFDQYKRHFKKGIDKKTVRVIGAFGPKAMPVTQDTFNFKADPDVRIESRFISQARKREQRNMMAAYGNVLMATPGANMRSYAKDMGRLMFSKAIVDKYLPPTVDEMRAEDENEKLNKDTLQGVKIEATDDHKTHLEIHGKAADTKAKFAHVEAHKRAMMIQRNSPELFSGLQIGEPAPNQAAQPGQPGLPQQAGPATPQQAITDLLPSG